MGISIWNLLIILLIIVLLFGSKKIRSLGADLGSSLRGFKKELNDDKEQPRVEQKTTQDTDADFTSEVKRERKDEPAGRD